MDTKLLAKFLLMGAVLLGIFALGRGFLYFNNNEAELGLVNSATQEGIGNPTGVPELPHKLLIPKIEVEADVQHLGVTDTGNMAAPSNFTDVSWYKYGTTPGEKGSAVMAGHEDNALTLPGVFYDLHKLEIGDDIYVVRNNGERLHFKVVEETVYAYDDPKPLTKIFNRDDGTYLNLITCAGDWVPEAKTNDRRLVIYAKLVE